MIELYTEQDQAPAASQAPVSAKSVAKKNTAPAPRPTVKPSLPVQAPSGPAPLPANVSQSLQGVESALAPYIDMQAKSNKPVLNMKMVPKNVAQSMQTLGPIVARYKNDLDMYYKDKKMGSKNADVWSAADLKAATNADPELVRKAFKLYDNYRSMTSLKQKPVSEVTYSPSFGGSTNTFFSYNPQTDFTEFAMKHYGYEGYDEGSAIPAYFKEKAAPPSTMAPQKPMSVALPTK